MEVNICGGFETMFIILKCYYVNRVHESLRLFGEIVNSSVLANSGMILFLNKKDLFEEKIRQVDLLDVFPDYKGIY